MRLYLAAPFSTGHMSPLWTAALGGGLENAMRLFVAGEHEVKNGSLARWDDLYVLETYYYARSNKHAQRLLKENKARDILLDSGAFSFMSDKRRSLDWARYVDEYAEFVKNYNISNFFELDIDAVVDLPTVLKLRHQLESRVGRQSIPVWHRSRGKGAWLQMCQEYKYVAIGGIVTGEIKRKDFPVFAWFLSAAQKTNTKVHGLGFTGIANLSKYPFYSVDSTAWLYGNRGGFLYRFNGQDLDKIDAPASRRMKSRETAIHNFNEWVKFMRYADKHL